MYDSYDSLDILTHLYFIKKKISFYLKNGWTIHPYSPVFENYDYLCSLGSSR